MQLAILLLLAHFSLTQSCWNISLEKPPSPCPDVFQYVESPSSGIGTNCRWFGAIHLSAEDTTQNTTLKIELDREAVLLGNWIGVVTSTNNIDYEIVIPSENLKPGQATTVQFFVQQNATKSAVTNPTPRLKAIKLNSREICNTNNYQPAVNRPVISSPSINTPKPDTVRLKGTIKTTTPPPVNEPLVQTLDESTLSPCPDIFQYIPPPKPVTAGRWYGVINLSTDNTLYSLWLNIVLDRKADLLGNWIGDVTTTDNVDFKIENTTVEISPGRATAITFFVQYNTLNPAPRLRSIRLNGRQICNSNSPQPPRNRPAITSRPTITPIQALPLAQSKEPTRPSSSKVPVSYEDCGVVDERFAHVPLIHGGERYNRGELPWLVAIYRIRGGTLSFICGGTLLSDRHVVTAAHCMHYKKRLLSNSEVVVKIGAHDLNDWGDDITITRQLASATIHESFNSTSLLNDIAIITLSKRVEFNAYIKPACLWHDRTELSAVVGSKGLVAGWGDQGRPGTTAGEPHRVWISIVSTDQCRASKPQFHYLTSRNTLCAGDRNGEGPCTGDSGGGLYLQENGKWRIRGVVSVSLRSQYGDSDCDLQEYIIFTDTAQYLTWIRKKIPQT